MLTTAEISYQKLREIHLQIHRPYTYPLPIFKQYDHYANLQNLPLCKRFLIPPKVIQEKSSLWN